MESISHLIRGSQQRGTVKVYPLGIHIDSPLKGFRLSKNCGGGGEVHKRGDITAFSSASRRRMREVMLTRYIEGAFLVGSTFTVPWKGSDFSPLMDEFRECWHRFGVSFRRKYPNSAMIYRVELQERGAPHVHALVWLDKADASAVGGAPVALPTAAAVGFAGLSLREMWLHSVPNLHRGSYRAFERYGVKVEPIADAGAMFRYLADHASKHKQAQLGYKGKQWGIIGDKNLKKRKSLDLPPFVSPKHEAIFLRLLRKVMRYRFNPIMGYCCKHGGKVKDFSDVVRRFSTVLKGSRRVVGDFYLRQDTVIKMFNHALDLVACVPRGTIV